MKARGILYSKKITKSEIGCEKIKRLDNYTKLHLAWDDHCPRYVLEILSKDKDKYVRRAVSNNLNITYEIMLELKDDSDSLVRENIALHPLKSKLACEV